MNTVWQDIRYGASMLSKTPGVSIVVIIPLALGIGLVGARREWIRWLHCGMNRFYKTYRTY